ncbi:MAG: hypothetical protein AAF515_16205 [Pseudomonadota bacterium]
MAPLTSLAFHHQSTQRALTRVEPRQLLARGRLVTALFPQHLGLGIDGKPQPVEKHPPVRHRHAPHTGRLCMDRLQVPGKLRVAGLRGASCLQARRELPQAGLTLALGKLKQQFELTSATAH